MQNTGVADSDDGPRNVHVCVDTDWWGAALSSGRGRLVVAGRRVVCVCVDVLNGVVPIRISWGLGPGRVRCVCHGVGESTRASGIVVNCVCPVQVAHVSVS